MKWVPFDTNKNTEFSDYTLVIPSCGSVNVDQMCIDLFCFKYGEQIGRMVSCNVNYVVSPNPYKEGGCFASSIDVYKCSIPRIGESIGLRISSSMPLMKRKIFDYSKELIELSKILKIKELLIVRSVSSVLCVDSQIRDWPFSIRGHGQIINKLSLIPLEQYSDIQSLVKQSVFGELYHCLEISKDISISLVIFFVNEGNGFNEGKFLASALTGDTIDKVPYSWESY